VARTIPSDAWLTAMRASVTPSTAVEGGVADPLRGSIQSPAIEIVGCTTSQDKVAAVISSLRRVDGVQRVSLSSSAAGAGGSGSACGKDAADAPQFSMTVFFDAPTGTATTGATGTAAAPASTTPTTTAGGTTP
jgi:hypothetical protein